LSAAISETVGRAMTRKRPPAEILSTPTVASTARGPRTCHRLSRRTRRDHRVPSSGRLPLCGRQLRRKRAEIVREKPECHLQFGSESDYLDARSDRSELGPIVARFSSLAGAARRSPRRTRQALHMPARPDLARAQAAWRSQRRRFAELGGRSHRETPRSLPSIPPEHELRRSHRRGEHASAASSSH
jgi:hypothetical protein